MGVCDCYGVLCVDGVCCWYCVLLLYDYFVGFCGVEVFCCCGEVDGEDVEIDVVYVLYCEEFVVCGDICFCVCFD